MDPTMQPARKLPRSQKTESNHVFGYVFSPSEEAIGPLVRIGGRQEFGNERGLGQSSSNGVGTETIEETTEGSSEDHLDCREYEVSILKVGASQTWQVSQLTECVTLTSSRSGGSDDPSLEAVC